MTNIFNTSNLIDFIFINNTKQRLKIHPNANTLEPNVPTKLSELISFCEFKKYYLENNLVQDWFDSGLISYTPITGIDGITCSFENSSTSIPVSATPPSGPINGSLWIRSSDRVLFIYDSSRSKWLSDSFIKISASRNHATVTDQYLMSDEGIYTNIDPFVFTDNLTITKIIAKSSTNTTWTLKLKNNNDDTDIASIPVTSGSITNVTANIDINANTPLAFYLEGTNIGYPNVDLIARYKG